MPYRRGHTTVRCQKGVGTGAGAGADKGHIAMLELGGIA